MFPGLDSGTYSSCTATGGLCGTRPLCLISVQQETCTGLLPLSDANGKKSLFGDFGAAGFEFGLMLVDTTNCRFGAFLACNGL